MTDIIIANIPAGRENAIKKEDLQTATGFSDRALRREIQAAREKGVLILNAQDGRGYFRADESDIDELKAQYRQDTARALSILRRRKTIRAILKKAGVDV